MLDAKDSPGRPHVLEFGIIEIVCLTFFHFIEGNLGKLAFLELFWEI